jgi:hypothetical protein
MLEAEIKKLTAAIEALTARLDADTPAVEAEPKAPAVQAKVEAPALEAKVEASNAVVSIEDLTRVCLALSRAGKKDAIKAKLSDLGVTRVGELTGDDYASFAAWAAAQ